MNCELMAVEALYSESDVVTGLAIPKPPRRMGRAKMSLYVSEISRRSMAGINF